MEASDWCRRTFYLTPDYSESGVASLGAQAEDPWDQRLAAVTSEIGASGTGLVVFLGEEQAKAIAPPLPLAANVTSEGFDTSQLAGLLASEPLIGVVLLRLGRYAVGVLRGDTLIASKSGSRYVKSRHRAGGSSQRRFERSRERLVRELFDKTCEVSRSVFSPHEGDMDHVLMGGERHTLGGLVRRCPYLKALEAKTVRRFLNVDRPGQRALDRVGLEVWKSQVVTFAPAGSEPGESNSAEV